MPLEGVNEVVRRLCCTLVGHAVDARASGPSAAAPRGRCGAAYLLSDGRTTHIRHTLSCFLRHHTYRPLAKRDGVHEYVCIRCGHPLIVSASDDGFAERVFTKRVRYLCGLLGHRVRRVTVRDGFVEYARGCGHSFLRQDRDLRSVRR